MLQAQFNAFVPPASVDWMAYEWRPGDFVRHFAGCPWQAMRWTRDKPGIFDAILMRFICGINVAFDGM